MCSACYIRVNMFTLFYFYKYAVVLKIHENVSLVKNDQFFALKCYETSNDTAGWIFVSNNDCMHLLLTCLK